MANKEIVIQQMPHPDAVTATQIDNLLRIAGTMMPMFLNPMRESENIPGKDGPPLEARIAAETTFMAVCSALDSIVTDKARFSTEFQKACQARADEIHAHNLEFLRAQTAASAELTAPHFRYRPTLQRMSDGEWTAFLGDPRDVNNLIAGIGKTPHEALLAFDDMFAGRVPAHMIDWLILHENALNAGKPSPPLPKLNYEKTMDRRRTKPTRNPSRRRKTGSGDGSDSEALTGLS